MRLDTTHLGITATANNSTCSYLGSSLFKLADHETNVVMCVFISIAGMLMTHTGQ